MALEGVTAAILNLDLRDNLLVLSTHQHTGLAGQGDDELSGLDILAFDDVAADPSIAGQLKRNGANLKFHNGTKVVSFAEADAAAATPSPRTLGAGALQAAPGTHTHSPTDINQSIATVTNPMSNGLNVTVDAGTLLTNVEQSILTINKTPGAANRSWVIFATMIAREQAGVANYHSNIMRIYVNGNQRITTTFSALNTGAAVGWVRYVTYVEVNPSVVAQNIELRVLHANDVTTAPRVYAALLNVEEVKVS